MSKQCFIEMDFKKIVFWEEIKSKEKVLELKPELVLLNREEETEFKKGKIELLELVNEKEKKVLTVSAKIHNKLGVYCKVIHLIVFNSKTEIFLQKRSKLIDTHPGKFTCSTAGHISLGDTPKKTALKEAEEEIGIKFKKIKFIAKFRVEDPIHLQFVYLFKTIHEGSFKLDKEEIEEAGFYSLQEIKNMNKGNFTPAFKKDLEILEQKKII